MHTISPLGWATVFCAVVLLGAVSCSAQTLGEAEVRNIGSQLELFVDDWLIESMQGAELRLHHPVPRELVWDDTNLVSGEIWGGANRSVTVFQDGDIYRMYYRDLAVVDNPVLVSDWFGDENIVCCYAESRDGIHWERPDLDIFETDDLKHNNIVWAGTGGTNFAVFKDTNPNCPPQARYKAIGRVMYQAGKDPSPPQPDATGYNWPSRCGIVAFQSPDGIHWSLMQEERIIKKGEFDSYNVAFWDAARGRYVAFIRIWMPNGTRIRSVATLLSDDFLHWTDPPQWLEYGDVPAEHLYDNNITVYPRAPHLFMGFPMRLVGGRTKIPDNPLPSETAVDDTVFMTSRDGVRFHRWVEGFIRPGPLPGGWWNENNCVAWGIAVTKSHIEGVPDELSFYMNEYYAGPKSNLRRYTLRMDGFVSVNVPYAGGEMLTRPLIFEGRELVMNYSTSAVGSVRVEIQDQEGNPIPGHTLADCPEIYGDAIEEVVKWKGGSDVSALAGQVVRLRFVLKDADLYAIRFRLSDATLVTSGPLQFEERLIRDGYDYAWGTVAADLDGDGDLDLTSSDTRGELLLWFENDGNGSLTQRLIYEKDPGWFERHAAADINGDGHPDIVVVKNLIGHLLWFENDGTPADGKLWKRHVMTTSFFRAYDVAPVDLDEDGDFDVAASSFRGNHFAWFENPGKTGLSQEWTQYVIDENLGDTRTICAADFNQDGKVDLLGTARTVNLVAWYENTGNPRDVPWPRHDIDRTSVQPTHGHPVDLDGDGDLDVIMAFGMRAEPGQADTNQAAWYENVGSPGKGAEWKKHVIGVLEYGFEVVAGDLDSDGDLDVVGTGSHKPTPDNVSWFENPGDPRGPWEKHLLKNDWCEANQVIVADLDSDGRLDIAATACDPANEFRWWRNLGPRTP